MKAGKWGFSCRWLPEVARWWLHLSESPKAPSLTLLGLLVDRRPEEPEAVSKTHILIATKKILTECNKNATNATNATRMQQRKCNENPMMLWCTAS
jgi:hypothetical protein